MLWLLLFLVVWIDDLAEHPHRQSAREPDSASGRQKILRALPQVNLTRCLRAC
ncbi:hypothetical protein GCM10022278_36500 [Allohahella marinimesophila]|uniref:Uncharacterized protein n=1 Tax=Allohahella marinimesophila TaxID=1054972 RepID=A0ABP7Q7F5_9GAMM